MVRITWLVYYLYLDGGTQERIRIVRSMFSLTLHSEFSEYQHIRKKFVPASPGVLVDPVNNKLKLEKKDMTIAAGLKEIFPSLIGAGMPYIEFANDAAGESLKRDKPLRVGVVLSGGQAAGGHNVIMGVYDSIKKLHPESKLFGFLMGPHGVFSNNYMEITPEYMDLYRNMGGFDMICKSSPKI